MNTPGKVLICDMTEHYHSVLNCNASGIDSNGNIIDQSKLPKTKSNGRTKETWLAIVPVLLMWKDADDIKSLRNDQVKIQ